MSELILTIEPGLYRKAQKYAEEQGQSLTQLVENHLKHLIARWAEPSLDTHNSRDEDMMADLDQYARRLMKDHL
ncbi:hypothetical protein GCM10023116_08840 [Kistimonas scapharcae]|uniref:CopG family transcriptional regulator n=1 Tax=Kistimonas scapharcae TaxID=1036133 RepID=A0ABP8UXQ0_9GAMM